MTEGKEIWVQTLAMSGGARTSFRKFTEHGRREGEKGMKECVACGDLPGAQMYQARVKVFEELEGLLRRVEKEHHQQMQFEEGRRG